MYYLKDSPLELHRDKAVERIIEIELAFEQIKEDVEKNEDLGLLFDYKSRFRKEMDTPWVQDEIFKALGEAVRLDGNHSWVNAESQFLKIEVYKACSRQEIFTYSLLEEYVKNLRKAFYAISKKITAKKVSVAFSTGLIVILVFMFFLFLELIGVNIMNSLYVMIKKHPLLFLMISFMSLLSVRNMLKYLDKEHATCQLIINNIAKELIHLKIAFIIKVDYGQCIKELHNMEEWGMVVSEKSLWSYAWAEEEKMEFKSHQLRPLLAVRKETIDE
jgi:hypothetical protein